MIISLHALNFVFLYVGKNKQRDFIKHSNILFLFFTLYFSMNYEFNVNIYKM